MKNKGFTLIELLAVIVILGVILTFAIMKVSEFVEKAEKQTLIKEADSILDVVRYQISSGKELLEEYNIQNGTFVEENKFSYSGGLPESGKILIKNNEELSIAISDGYWCVTKSYMDKNYSIKKDDGNCTPTFNINSDDEMAKCFTFANNSSPGYGESTGLAISKYTCSGREIVIPSTYNNQPIIGVEPMNCIECIDKIDMSYAINLKYIGMNALENVGLEEVILGPNISKISYNAFENNNLTSIIFPKLIDDIYDSSFRNNKLKSVTFLGNFENINIRSLAFNNNLLPDNQSFFIDMYDTLISYGGEKKDNVVIPNYVKRIHYSAFGDCGLTSVVIPSTVTYIDSSAFYGNNLNTVTFMSNSNLSSNGISYGAFLKNSISNPNLTSIIYTGVNAQNWNDAINGSSSTSFVTGTVTNPLGNVTISAN